MAATFAPALPTPKDRVRFYVGDVGTVEGKYAFLVTDELIAGVLGLQSDELLAAADIADQLAAMFSQRVDSTNLSLSISESKRAEAYRVLARRLRGRAGIAETEEGVRAQIAEMFVGGLSQSDKQDLAEDSDRLQPAFRRGQDDHPGVGTQDTTPDFVADT